MQRTLYIYYRHVHSNAEKNSRDPNKQRPDWFSYESCFRNLLWTIRNDPQGQFVNLTVMFDGNTADFIDDFVSKYFVDKDINFQIEFLNAGSDKNSALITLDYIYKARIPNGNLVYMLENDYMHQPGWVSKVFELYNSKIKFNYLSLYDHNDKYILKMYEELTSLIFHSDTQHWRTAPSTCGSFIFEINQYYLDFDIFREGLADYYLFNNLVNKRNRILLTAIPGLSTHCMEGYLSPTINWKNYMY